jgi:hypothetical protein
MKLSFIIAIFLLISAFFIISNEKIQLNSKENIIKFGNIYYSWLLNGFEKTSSITGHIIKADWLPEASLNETN